MKVSPLRVCLWLSVSLVGITDALEWRDLQATSLGVTDLEDRAPAPTQGPNLGKDVEIELLKRDYGQNTCGFISGRVCKFT